MPSRRSIVLFVLVAGIIFGWLGWRAQSSTQSPNRPSFWQRSPAPAAIIDKQPVAFASRTFDPASPPDDMPPLGVGENAECESNFMSEASVGGQTQRVDATHALITITQIKITLRLNITIWVPTNVTQHVIEHEEGHRQIDEYYYQTADQLAQRIAAKYMGNRVEIAGSDLNAESSKMLQQTAAEITDEYDKELNPDPTQLLYDSITDHSRNETVATDAVAAAVKNIAVESPPAATNPGN